MIGRAARVRDAIAHRTFRGGLLGMAVGAAIGGAIVVGIGFFTLPATATVGLGTVLSAAVATLAGSGTMFAGVMASTWIVTQTSQFARNVGEWLEGDIKVDGVIAAGAHTVTTGTRHAAMASRRCTVSCHSAGFVAEGSDSVVIEDGPAARKGDKTSCEGMVYDGDTTVSIGGEPTSIAGAITVQQPDWYRTLRTGHDYANTIAGAPWDRLSGGKKLSENLFEWGLWFAAKGSGTYGRQDLPGHTAAAHIGGWLDAVRGGRTFDRAATRFGQDGNRQTAVRLGVGIVKLEIGARSVPIP